MTQMIFINLPVADVEKSIAFYEAVGFTNNPAMTGNGGAGMVLSDTIYVMLTSHARWADFTSKTIMDARKSAEVLLCVSRETRADVDAMVEAAVAAGGVGDISPIDEYGFMYGRSFEDLDGHSWAPTWMDMAAMGEHAGSAD